MHDEPYPSRYYPRPDREPTITAAVSDLHQQEPVWRGWHLRLMLFVLVFYVTLTLLYLISNGSHAAASQSIAPQVSVHADCAMGLIAGK